MELDRRAFLLAGAPTLAALTSGCGGEWRTNTKTDQKICDMFSHTAQLLHRPDGMNVLRVTIPGEYIVQSLFENKYLIQSCGEWKFSVKDASTEKPYDCELPGINTGNCTQVIRYVTGEGLQVERYGRENRK